MRTAIFSGLVVIAAALFGACVSPDNAEPAKLATDDHKTIYALGIAVSQSLSPFDLNEEEVSVLLSGLRESLTGKEPRVDMAEFGPKIDALAADRRGASSEKEKQASAGFLEKAAAEEGAVTTDSGLVFRETQAGSGVTPVETDTVKVHYHGTLRDGTVFDSSVDRGQPASFPLNRVIPCWTEALQKMKVGGKAVLTCPSAIAYADRGSGRIMPGAALRFEVELLEIGN